MGSEIWRVRIAAPSDSLAELARGERYMHFQGPMHSHYWALVPEHSIARWTSHELCWALRELRHRACEDMEE